MAISKSVKDNLERIKKNISTSYTYFKTNAERYRDFRRYVFKESLNYQQRAMLQEMQRPVVEFNILEAYISRLLGEFAKHEPSIHVSPAEGVPVDQAVIDLVEGHLRHIMHQANKDNFSYEVYKDILSGGYSVMKVWTDYASPMSFKQQLYLGKAFDPTLCGFDPMARYAHKGDGHYCFEIFPMHEDDFKREFPDVELANMSYLRDIEGFNWSYKDNNNQKIVLVADYYEKKKKRTKIVQLANGRVMTEKNYERFQRYWEEQQFIEQIPALIGKPRWTDLEVICKYRLVENQILEYHETDYTYLPLIFVDGNSVLLTDGETNNIFQMTRPYVYHAKGVQDLKNFAGQSLANYLENIVQHKFIVMKEAIPQEKDYLEALTNIQRMNTVVVNAYSENNPDKPIPTPIREVVNQPAPPEVMGAFQLTDPTTQTILGSYASNLGKNDNDLSGKAVIESSSVGNAAAMPYVVGYLQALTQVGNIIVDLMPKYLVGRRTITVMGKDGEKDYQEINSPSNPILDYDERAIHVNIDTGVNFQVQKNQAVEQIIALMSASPSLGEFFNDEDGGLPILAKNLTIYSADQLPEAIERWAQKKAQMKQEAMQMQQQAMQQNPQMIRAQAEIMKTQADIQQQQIDNQLTMAKLEIEKELATSKILESEAKVTQAQIESSIRLTEDETSRFNHEIDAATKMAEINFKEHQKAIDLHASHLSEKKLEHEIAGQESKNMHD